MQLTPRLALALLLQLGSPKTNAFFWHRIISSYDFLARQRRKYSSHSNASFMNRSIRKDYKLMRPSYCAYHTILPSDQCTHRSPSAFFLFVFILTAFEANSRFPSRYSESLCGTALREPSFLHVSASLRVC